MPGVEHTKGRVRHFVTTRFYYKPALGKIIIRKAGVTRRSDKVRAINEKLRTAPVKPATKCKGKPWDEFVKCLKREMKAVVGK